MLMNYCNISSFIKCKEKLFNCLTEDIVEQAYTINSWKKTDKKVLGTRSKETKLVNMSHGLDFWQARWWLISPMRRSMSWVCLFWLEKVPNSFIKLHA